MTNQNTKKTKNTDNEPQALEGVKYVAIARNYPSKTTVGANCVIFRIPRKFTASGREYNGEFLHGQEILPIELGEYLYREHPGDVACLAKKASALPPKKDVQTKTQKTKETIIKVVEKEDVPEEIAGIVGIKKTSKKKPGRKKKKAEPKEKKLEVASEKT